MYNIMGVLCSEGFLSIALEMIGSSICRHLSRFHFPGLGNLSKCANANHSQPLTNMYVASMQICA